MPAPYTPTHSETLVFIGAGATASLGMPSTDEQTKIFRALCGNEKSKEEILSSYFLGTDLTKVIAFLDFLGSDNFFEVRETDLQNAEIVYGKQYEKLLRNRILELRTEYDWNAAKKVLNICPHNEREDNLIRDVYSIIDGKLLAHQSLKVKDCRNKSDNDISSEAILSPSRLQGARNFLMLFVNMLFSAKWYKITNGEKSEEFEKYKKFINSFDRLMQKEARQFHGKYPKQSRDFYLFTTSFVSFNFEMVFPWIFMNSHYELNHQKSYIGDRPLKLWLDFGCEHRGRKSDDDGNIVSCTVVKAAQREGSDGKGTLYSKGNLTISGSGSLSVTQAYKNCIASKDGILTIDGGTLTLQNYLSSSTKSSATGKNGLFGGQGIVVNDGSITFNGYGIISTSDIRKANGFKTDDDDYTSSYVKINGGTVNVTTYNGKGINAPVVAIAGGRNTFTVTGITSYSERTSTGSWYDADGVKETGTVKFAPEGIEGASSVTFSGGTTIVSAPDDGVNVSTTGGTLTISGGFVYVKSQGDGLDSNGNIVISGGTAVVSQTGGGNSPIDCGDGSYSFKVTGTSATVFAMGSSDMFSESIPSSTVSPMIYSTSLGSSSSSLGINGIIAVKSPQTYAAAILISNSLTNGSSYSFVKDGTISGTLYNSDAGVYFPATVSGGTSVSATATTSSSSAGGNTSGSNFPGSGGFSGGGKR